MKTFTTNLRTKINSNLIKLETKMNEKRGDFAADKGIVIAITVAIAGLALALTFGVLKDTIGPEVEKAIKGFFNFS